MAVNHEGATAPLFKQLIMAWDIYGNTLQRGHCEVHPWVHDPYPCCLCYSDSERHEQADRQRQEYNEAIERDYYKAEREEFCNKNYFRYRMINKLLRVLASVSIRLEQIKNRYEDRLPI